MTSEDLLNILTYYHLRDFSSGRELLQALREDEYALVAGSHEFFDAKIMIGTPGNNQTQKPVRLVGYSVDDKDCWIAPTVSA